MTIYLNLNIEADELLHLDAMNDYYQLKDERSQSMEKWVCTICGYEYDPEVGDPDAGVEPGTAFEDLPEDWVCPDCGVGKDMFEKA